MAEVIYERGNEPKESRKQNAKYNTTLVAHIRMLHFSHTIIIIRHLHHSSRFAAVVLGSSVEVERQGLK